MCTCFASQIEGRPTYCSYELNFNTRVFQSFPILWADSHCPLYRFTIHIERTLLPSILIQLDIHHLPAIITIVKPDIDIQRGREKIRHQKHKQRSERGCCLKLLLLLPSWYCRWRCFWVLPSLFPRVDGLVRVT